MTGSAGCKQGTPALIATRICKVSILLQPPAANSHTLFYSKANTRTSYLPLLAGKQELAAHDSLAVSRQPQEAVQQHVVYWREPRHAHEPARNPDV